MVKVGETVRIYFGVGGPNFTSSFHLIGEIFDKVYFLGGTVIAEFKVDFPGNYTLLDHAIARAERGLVVYCTSKGSQTRKFSTAR
ncbi:hypothetical protein AC630_04615 [Bradyrhizobium sp. AS23.2]|nr:hypothetical protein AC630_04615 [Bradyrhizobium sp. AS23.2]